MNGIATSAGGATQRLLHLSDLHLTGTGRDQDGVDAAASLRRMLDDVRFVESLSAVIVTGDVADDGSPAGYRLAAELVGSFAASRGIPYVFTTGNHDDRSAFAQVLGSGHRAADGTDCGRPMTPTGCRAAVSDVDGLRVITLDTLVPGAVHGEVSEEQLRWLADVLDTRAPRGSVLAFHHPPVSVPGHPMTQWLLREPERLAPVVAGSDVRLVLCGHVHHQMSSTLDGIPVWVTPGVVTRIDTTSPEHLVRAVLGASATLVELGDGPPVFRLLSARDPRAGRQVYLYDFATGAETTSETA